MQHRGRTSQALPPPTDMAHLLGFGAVFVILAVLLRQPRSADLPSSMILVFVFELSGDEIVLQPTSLLLCFLFLFFFSLDQDHVGELRTEVEIS